MDSLMKWFLMAGVWMCCGWGLCAQGFDARDIPPALEKNARAVVREDVTSIEVKNLGEVLITCHKVITILHPNGRYLGAMVLNYDKSRPVMSISGALYNAAGGMLHRYKKKDFEDVSTSHDFSLFEDDRVKRLFPDPGSYPYTVAYDYTQKYKFTLALPSWFPVEAEGVAVQHSKFSITLPRDIPLRYFVKHARTPVLDSTEKTVSYRWSLTDQAAFPAESLTPPIFQSRVPLVLLSTERFSYYGMKGNFTDWHEFGRWVSEHFLKGRDELPEATRTKILALTASAGSAKEAARRIYGYVQQRTRYISIQVGKGGLVPMKASDVDKVGYGDCKALVNYTMALLKLAGIPAYYTLVYGGEDRTSMLAGFASAGQGDHVILCVPFSGDTTWLECTDQHMPFGFLGSFTDDRAVVVCTPEGGLLTHTPRYGDTLNSQTRRAWLTLDADGALHGKMSTRFQGLRYEKRAGLETLDASERIRRVRSAYGFLQMNIDTLKLGFHKQVLPTATEYVRFSSPLYAAPSAGGMSVPLNPVDRIGDLPERERHRVSKVVVMRGYETTDSLHFILGAGTKVSMLPAPAHFATRFGDYNTSIQLTGDELLYVRHFRLLSGTYPPDSYGTLVDFLTRVSGYDQENFLVTQ